MDSGRSAANIAHCIILQTCAKKTALPQNVILMTTAYDKTSTEPDILTILICG
jgi:hypothetical protein